MKKKSIICSLAVCACAFIALAAYIFAAPDKKAFAAIINYGDSPVVQDYYVLGEKFLSPEVQVEVDGVSYAVSSQVLYYPDGRAFSSKEYVLSNPGVYTLRFFAEISGKTVYAEKKFTVKGDAFSVSGQTSSAVYGTTSAEKGNIQGLIVSLAPGDTFTYYKAINLNDKRKDDALIKLFALPELQGAADVRDFKIRLTDVYNPDNYVEIAQFANIIDEDEAQKLPLYAGVGFSGGPYAGMLYMDGQYKDYRVQYEDGLYYGINKDVRYTSAADNGAYACFASSFAAINGYGYEAAKDFKSPFTYFFDYAERKVYGLPQSVEKSGTFGNNLIADLDDSLFFDKLWSGFTTGEVYLSVYSTDYVASSFNFVITEIYDNDLSLTVYENKNAPTIKVEVPENGAPYAIKDMPFTIFDAKAYSETDGVLECTVTVYSDYRSSERKLCKVTENAFVPKDASITYSAVYRATDSFGNFAEKVVDIEVIAERTASLTLEGTDLPQVTGKIFALKNPIISGTNGDYTLYVYAKKGESIYSVEKTADGYKFSTLEAGIYTIIYELSDYNGSVTKDYAVEVINNSYNTFGALPALPSVFVKNAEYIFPQMSGYTFVNGYAEEVTASLKYSFDDGTETVYTAGSKVNITADSNVKFIYSLNGAESDYVVTVPVTDVGLSVGKFYNEKYFYSTDFVGSSTENCVEYVTSAENAKLTFVKPLLVSNSSFKFTVSPADFASMTVKYTDTCDLSKVVTVKLTRKSASKLLVSVNGDTEHEITTMIQNVEHKFNINAVNKKIVIDDEFNFYPTGFAEFSGMTANLEISFEGVTEQLKIRITEIGGQMLSNQTTDYVRPAFYLDYTDGKKNIGDKLIINGLYLQDILSFVSSGFVTVNGPDSSVCVTTDGVEMKNITDFSRPYEINVNSYGTYKIVVSVTDGDNPGKITYNVNCYDDIAPVITVSGENKYSAVYAGKMYKIATASANDNLDGNVPVITMVMDTEEKMHIVTNGEFAFDKEGTYRVTYYAKDSSDNVCIESYVIIAVREG